MSNECGFLSPLKCRFCEPLSVATPQHARPKLYHLIILTRSLASHVEYNYNELFKNAADEIRQQHAEDVGFRLHNAKLSRHEAHAAVPDFREEVSPFVNLVPLVSGTVGAPTVEAKHHVSLLFTACDMSLNISLRKSRDYHNSVV